MASFTITRSSVCAGGAHHIFTCVASAKTVTVMLTPSEVTAQPSDDELQAAVAVLLKTKKYVDGLTNAQLLAQSITGLTVTISI